MVMPSYLSNDMFVWQQSIPQVQVSNVPNAFECMCHLPNILRHNFLHSAFVEGSIQTADSPCLGVACCQAMMLSSYPDHLISRHLVIAHMQSVLHNWDAVLHYAILQGLWQLICRQVGAVLAMVPPYYTA